MFKIFEIEKGDYIEIIDCKNHAPHDLTIGMSYIVEDVDKSNFYYYKVREYDFSNQTWFTQYVHEDEAKLVSKKGDVKNTCFQIFSSISNWITRTLKCLQGALKKVQG